MNTPFTIPRQVRVTRCSIIYPGLEFRASNDTDKQLLSTYGFDITAFVQKIDIYESIWNNTISGNITLLDTVALAEYLPIVGVELLMISFEIDVQSEDDLPRQFSRTFRVVKLHDQTFPQNDSRFYTLEFTTHEFVNSVSSRICRAFNNVSARDAVISILTNDLQVDPSHVITNEDTFGMVNVMIPNYPPLRAINYFTLLAQTKQEPHESNFLFFETLDGFHFTSIRALIQHALDAPDSSLKTFDVNPGQSVQSTIADTNLIKTLRVFIKTNRLIYCLISGPGCSGVGWCISISWPENSTMSRIPDTRKPLPKQRIWIPFLSTPIIMI